MQITDKSIWERELAAGPILTGILTINNHVYVVPPHGEIRAYQITRADTLSRLLILVAVSGIVEGGGVMSFLPDITTEQLDECFRSDERLPGFTIYGQRYEFERYTGPVHEFARKLQEEAHGR